ncbi:MAG TPA: hypothetical protein VLX90_00065 [Steroidobacteraceae bacterium]|nr:hypothetical protein [Steroidobacteraceae bacterium]
MDARSPYAPSPASLNIDGSRTVHGDGGGLWREGKVLVLQPDAALPARCVKCNGAAEEPTKTRRVYWHHPAVYLLILLNMLIYLIVALIVRKRASVAPGLCTAHKKRRLVGLILAWGGLFAGLALMFASIGNGSGNPGIMVALGLLLMLFAALVGIIATRVVYAKRIDQDYVRLRGCGAQFLDSLPEFPG